MTSLVTRVDTALRIAGAGPLESVARLPHCVRSNSEQSFNLQLSRTLMTCEDSRRAASLPRWRLTTQLTALLPPERSFFGFGEARPVAVTCVHSREIAITPPWRLHTQLTALH